MPGPQRLGRSQSCAQSPESVQSVVTGGAELLKISEMDLDFYGCSPSKPPSIFKTHNFMHFLPLECSQMLPSTPTIPMATWSTRKSTFGTWSMMNSGGYKHEILRSPSKMFRFQKNLWRSLRKYIFQLSFGDDIQFWVGYGGLMFN